MSIKKLSPEEALSLDKFGVDEGHPHIIVDKKICAKCTARPCLVVCPARLYREKDGEVNFEFAGCLECGTCRVTCTDGGITSWNYPRASFGVTFRCS
jgi:ferredoxin like protein